MGGSLSERCGLVLVVTFAKTGTRSVFGFRVTDTDINEYRAITDSR